jgi:hypothetical protein
MTRLINTEHTAKRTNTNKQPLWINTKGTTTPPLAHKTKGKKQQRHKQKIKSTTNAKARPFLPLPLVAQTVGITY